MLRLFEGSVADDLREEGYPFCFLTFKSSGSLLYYCQYSMDCHVISRSIIPLATTATSLLDFADHGGILAIELFYSCSTSKGLLYLIC